MKKILIVLVIIVLSAICVICGTKGYSYYSPAIERNIYQTAQHHDDTIRIAYIGDSWAFGHQFHECKIADILSKELSRPVCVSSYGIGGLTSKEIYHALFELDSLRHFMERGYDYCYISAGINDTYKKMSTTYYKNSMDCIIRLLLTNKIHPIIQEIPNYNINKTYENQKTEKKLIRQFSMLINHTKLDCKQDFRDVLDELINEKGYNDKISVIRYKSWNKEYENDLKRFYLDDGMHLNEEGYEVLDSMIAKTVSLHYASKHNLSYNIPK